MKTKQVPRRASTATFRRTCRLYGRRQDGLFILFFRLGRPEASNGSAGALRDRFGPVHDDGYFDEHVAAAVSLRQSILDRTDTLRAWLDCQASPGDAADRDGDGRPFCMDCRDDDPWTYPGAVELCGDGRDQNCDAIDPVSCP